MKFRIIDLYSGAGGLSLGFARQGRRQAISHPIAPKRKFQPVKRLIEDPAQFGTNIKRVLGLRSILQEHRECCSRNRCSSPVR